MNIYTVVITKNAKRDLQKVPSYIALKLAAWIEAVSHDGLLEVRKIPGFHDEPLKGNRVGQRSIRLSKAYRAIYEIDNNGEMEIVQILEVNKHDY
ncbi:type II toxin-antitoxin system RelE family toxin [Legionella maceachernii]|uniref:Plasmid stabilization system protein n=1 Tax=Legionella maceachernii TaxID=466 RepID=A0A0W0W014_9GAMM|nr:type II toxin-antitoxin system mRNA interferase toxin, RelE/StbE family [Legionella maceachernii]KTD25776.1 Plasmid stabilization system protein [Legionella maceachernii]SJZ91706.1 proteic killer suppression protein [Legionella maceachernii]SUP03623.1 Plasmid maintenance system killer protein [Legionella maceachernii]